MKLLNLAEIRAALLKKKYPFLIAAVLLLILVSSVVLLNSVPSLKSTFIKKDTSSELALEKRIAELESQIVSSGEQKSDTSDNVKNAQPVPRVVTTAKETTQSTSPAVPQPTTIVTTEQVKPVVMEFLSVARTRYEPTDKTYGYGSFQLKIKVTANGSDAYIPISTSDSTVGTGITGFSYSPTGDSFRGAQDSKISCSVRYKNYCKIKSGESETITTTVWLTPELAGNYGIRFSNVKIMSGEGSTFVSYPINQETDSIYITKY